MTLVPSLLQAIILMDGEALVLHVGDKPYVVADSGQVNLANTPMTASAVADVVDELLPPESKRALADVGATQCILPEHPSFPRERFSVVAARGGDDVWLEIRRAPLSSRQAPVAEVRHAGVVPPAPVPATSLSERVVTLSERAAPQAEPATTGPQPVPPPVAHEPETVVAFTPPLPASEPWPEPLVTVAAQPEPAANLPLLQVEAEPVVELAPVVMQAEPAVEHAPVAVQPEADVELAPVAVQPEPAGELPLIVHVPEPAIEVPVLVGLPEPVAEVFPVETRPLEPVAAPAPVVPDRTEPETRRDGAAEVHALAPAPAALPKAPVPPKLPVPPPFTERRAASYPAFTAVDPPRRTPEPIIDVPARAVASVAERFAPLTDRLADVPAERSYTAPQVFTPAERLARLAERHAQPPQRPVAPPARATVPFDTLLARPEPPAPAAPPVAAATPTLVVPPSAVVPEPVSQPLVVVPLARPSVSSFVAPHLLPEAAASGLDRLLRLAAARGATALYLVSGAHPAVRVDDEVRPLDGAGALESHELEAILLSLVPEQGTALTGSAASGEWTSDFEDLGRVRCLSFRDHRGPGCVFRLMPKRALTTQQLGLSRDVQSLIGESDGLVVVTGPRHSGKRTLMAAFVDQINRTRHAHVITIEHDVAIVHDRAGSLISQREVRQRGQVAEVARQALREDPDVLVLEDVHSVELMELALDAASAGRLVICGFAARGTASAVERMLELSPASERRLVQLLLARNLRAVVAQVLLRKPGGGRLAARELLVNTPAIAALIAEGRTSQLPTALEGGRRQGMVPLNDALASLVQGGTVDVAEAWRAASDRPGLLTLLQRQGIDTSAVEKLA